MANANIVNGFTPIRRQSGGPMVLERFYVDSTNSVANLGVGTMMALVANTSSVSVPEVIIAGVGAVPVGPLVAFDFDPDAQNRLYLPSSTSGYVFINSSPDLIMEVQADGTVEDGDIGSNSDLIDADTSTTTGASGQEIDSAKFNTTDTLVFHIRRLLDREDNALGEFAVLEVSFNLHAYGMAAVSEGNLTGVHN